MRSLLAISRKADADQAPVRLGTLLPRPHGREVDRRHRALQRLRIVAAVEMLVGDVVERHLLGPHQILPSHLVRLDPGFARHRVEHEFEREAHPGAGDPAIRQDRAFVGGDGEGAAAVGGKIVRPREDARHLRGLQAGGERVG